ncbi:hypothetical protein COP2_009682 [Malus domestica]
METTLKLGLACCHPDPMRRPNMNEIVSILVGEATTSMAPAAMLSKLSRGVIVSTAETAVRFEGLVSQRSFKVFIEKKLLKIN